jgi:hypothetical protein
LHVLVSRIQHRGVEKPLAAKLIPGSKHEEATVVSSDTEENG